MDKLLQCSAEYEKIMVNVLNYPPYEDSDRSTIEGKMLGSFQKPELAANHTFIKNGLGY